MAVLADLERKNFNHGGRHLFRKIIKYKTAAQIIFLDYPLIGFSMVS